MSLHRKLLIKNALGNLPVWFRKSCVAWYDPQSGSLVDNYVPRNTNILLNNKIVIENSEWPKETNLHTFSLVCPSSWVSNKTITLSYDYEYSGVSTNENQFTRLCLELPGYKRNLNATVQLEKNQTNLSGKGRAYTTYYPYLNPEGNVNDNFAVVTYMQGITSGTVKMSNFCVTIGSITDYIDNDYKIKGRLTLKNLISDSNDLVVLNNSSIGIREDIFNTDNDWHFEHGSQQIDEHTIQLSYSSNVSSSQANAYTAKLDYTKDSIVIKVNGLNKTGQVLRLGCQAYGFSGDIARDGVFVVQVPGKGYNNPWGFFFGNKNQATVTVEELPKYDGAVIFNGNNIGVSPLMPITKDYTIIARRVILDDWSPATMSFRLGYTASEQHNSVSDRDQYLITSNGYLNDLTNEVNHPNNGYTNLVMTPTKYNTLEIQRGTRQGDNDTLYIGGTIDLGGNKYIYNNKQALYSFLVFNRILTDEEIKWCTSNVCPEIPIEYSDLLANDFISSSIYRFDSIYNISKLQFNQDYVYPPIPYKGRNLLKGTAQMDEAYLVYNYMDAWTKETETYKGLSVLSHNKLMASNWAGFRLPIFGQNVYPYTTVATFYAKVLDPNVPVNFAVGRAADVIASSSPVNSTEWKRYYIALKPRSLHDLDLYSGWFSFYTQSDDVTNTIYVCGVKIEVVDSFDKDTYYPSEWTPAYGEVDVTKQ